MKKYLIILTAAALAFGGCKKFLDKNQNPNSATVTNAKYVFTNAQAVTAANQVGGVNAMGSSWVGYWGHSTSFTGGGQEKTYVFTNADFNYWDGMYNNLADYRYVINHASADGVGYLSGPAKVMTAYVFQKLVDLYGNIPYTKAFSLVDALGNPSASLNFSPSYDNQQTVYEDLVTQLTSAISEMKAASWPTIETSDIMFKGDKTSWVKFANTVKLRILMRQANMSGRAAYITPKLNEIVAEGSGFITSDVTVQPGYQKATGSTGSKENPMYLNYGYDNNDAVTSYSYRQMGKVVIDYLKSTNDLFRLSRIATTKGYDPSSTTNLDPTNINNYSGIPLGAPTGYLSSANSNIGSMVIVKGDAGRPLVLFPLSQAYLLEAEAANRYGLFGSDAALYALGVQAAFRQTAPQFAGAPTATTAQADAAAAAYVAGAGAYGGPGAAGLTTIWRQEYLALVNIDGEEAWSEYRRTNALPGNTGIAPTNPQSVATSSPQPVRLYYPQREQNVNTANYVNVNVFTDRLFWDAQ
jgi:hypothetical protein